MLHIDHAQVTCRPELNFMACVTSTSWAVIVDGCVYYTSTDTCNIEAGTGDGQTECIREPKVLRGLDGLRNS